MADLRIDYTVPSGYPAEVKWDASKGTPPVGGWELKLRFTNTGKKALVLHLNAQTVFHAAESRFRLLDLDRKKFLTPFMEPSRPISKTRSQPEAELTRIPPGKSVELTGELWLMTDSTHHLKEGLPLPLRGPFLLSWELQGRARVEKRVEIDASENLKITSPD